MALDPVTNFGKVTASTTYNDTDTTVVLSTADGAKLPDTALGAFNLTWWNSSDYPNPSDDPNKEIIRVTTRVTDTLTVTRGQEGTVGSTKNTASKTYSLVLAVTKKTIDDIQTEIDALIEGPASATDNAIVRYDLTTGKLVQDSVITISDTGDIANIDSLVFDLTTVTNASQGEIRWDNDLETFVFGIDSTSVPLNNPFYIVRNSTGATLTKGTPVYANGTLGASSRVTVDKMIADGTVDSSLYLGILLEDVANGVDGIAIAQGKLRGIDTSSWTEGDKLYISTTVAGTFTNVQPTAPNLKLAVAFVIYSDITVGSIETRAFGGLQLAGLHDVDITSIATGELIKWDGTKWINQTLAEAGIAATIHTHSLTDVTDVTATSSEVNLLDLAGLTAGWVLSADTATTASWKAPDGGATLEESVTQTTHGLVVGDWVKSSGTDDQYSKAQANSAANAEVVGVVTVVTDVNNFTFTYGGMVSVAAAVPAQVAGTVLFLDTAVAGGVVTTETTTVGEISKPVAVVVENGAQMKILGMRGMEITAASSADVVGPASATDNALARFDTTTGKLIQEGTISASDAVSGEVFMSAIGSNDLIIRSGGTQRGVIYLREGAGAKISLAPNFPGAVSIGSGLGSGIIESSGNYDLTLRTGNATTGSIIITDGANGDITLAPNGTGTVALNTGVSGTAFLDEDDLVSDSATKLASQQSIKAYVDAAASGITSDVLIPKTVLGDTGVYLQVQIEATEMYLGLFYIPEEITVTKVSLSSKIYTNAGTLIFSCYSSDGQTQHFSSTTTSVDTGSYAMETASVASVILSAGYYLFGVQRTSTGASPGDDLFVKSYSSPDTEVRALLTSVTDTIISGIYTVTAGIAPSTITLASISADYGSAPLFRIDS